MGGDDPERSLAMSEKCIKNVSMTGQRCNFPAEMSEVCMTYMCENKNFTHFFTHYELVEFKP